MRVERRECATRAWSISAPGECARGVPCSDLGGDAAEAVELFPGRGCLSHTRPRVTPTLVTFINRRQLLLMWAWPTRCTCRISMGQVATESVNSSWLGLLQACAFVIVYHNFLIQTNAHDMCPLPLQCSICQDQCLKAYAAHAPTTRRPHILSLSNVSMRPPSQVS